MLAVAKRNQEREQRLQAVLDSTERIFADNTFIPRNRKKILGPMPSQEEYQLAKKNIQIAAGKAGVSAEMLPCWREPLLSKEQEQHLSKKFNFLKSLARDNALKGRLARAEQFLKQAQEVRDVISLANMRLAIAVIKKIYSRHKDDLLSEAFMAVHKATDYFDWRKGFKFSTYATWVISKNLWRTNTLLQKEDNFQSSDFEATIGRDVGLSDEFNYNANLGFVKDLLRHLTDDREREIIKLRFGIGCRPMTLEECGVVFGVTKERIRQLQERAIRKLRGVSGGQLKEVA